MSENRWPAIERIFHEALQRPPEERAAFLAAACGSDVELRREVQSLLDQPSSTEFLETPAIRVAAGLVTEVSGDHLIGRRIGVYEIDALLGKGGMGEVYRARDTRLGREVAIKVLPQAFTANPERLARFEREARLLAALNHPHIGTIHGLEEGDGVLALVLELVEGKTLADVIARGPVPIKVALGWARQIADALDAAHEKGIVHRDLKPANVKITPNDVVKVLDFGLARADPDNTTDILRHSPTITAEGTQGGVILGTAAYMSPEQARGHIVDKRADVWAFGVVFYELLTGRSAFGGETVSDTLAAILQKDPDWDALPAGLPASVTALLKRCLEKDVKRRRRDIGDVRAELDDAMSAPLQSAAPVHVAAPRSRIRTALPWLIAAAAGILAIAAGWSRLSGPAAWRNPIADAQFLPLTDFPGAEREAVISADGRFVTFESDRTGLFHVWLTQVGTGRFTDLTAQDGDQRVAAHGNRSLGFSGDGSEVWHSGFPVTKRRLQVLPFIGDGVRRTFLDENAANVQWSPDGSRIVYNASRAGDPVFVADRFGANAKQIHADQIGTHNHGPIWSVNGQWIYFLHGFTDTGELDIWRIRPTGDEAEALTHSIPFIGAMAALDPQTIVYTARTQDGAGPWLWSLDVKTKATHRLSSGLEQYTSIAASADGKRLVASVAHPRASLWSVPILDRMADGHDVRPYGTLGSRALAPRPSGNALFYLSALGTGDGLWHLQDGKSREIWNGSRGALLEAPGVSPDGQHVVIVLRKNGHVALTVLDVDTSVPRSLADAIDVRGTACFSPDGKWIVFGGAEKNGKLGLFKVAPDGGAPIKIVSGSAVDPVWSRHDLILYVGENVAASVKVIGVHPDGTPVDFGSVSFGAYVARPRLLPDGSGVVYLQGKSFGSDFWLLDFATRKSRQLTQIPFETGQGDIRTFDITPDGKQIVFDRVAENSDIVLIQRPPQ